MDYYLNQLTNNFTRSIGFPGAVTGVTFKARDTVTLNVFFHNGAQLLPLAQGYQLVFAIKGGFGANDVLLALAHKWTQVAPGHYRAQLNLNTVPLIAQMGEAVFVNLFAELSWSESPGNWESSPTLKVRMENDLYKGEEGTPLELPTPLSWLTANLNPALTAYADAPDAAARRGLIGALGTADLPPEFNPVALYRPPFDAMVQGSSGNVVAEGLFTAGKGLTIQLVGREFGGNFDILSQLFVVSSTGERVLVGSVVATNGPKYFELRILDIVDLSNPQTTFWTLTDGWMPLSPALRNFLGSVNFSGILDETIEATAETYLSLSNCSATTAKLGAGSQVVVDSCSNLQTVILDFGDLEIESCNQLTNIENASLTNYLSVVDCIAYGESVSGGDSGLRYFNNTGIVNFVATGNYNTLNFINNVDLVSVDLSRVTLCAFLLFTNNPNHNVDDMLNSIVNFAAFAGGVIGLDYPATSASQSAQDSLIAAGCAIIVN